MDALTRAALMLEALDASLAELREIGDPRNNALIGRLEAERERSARELQRLAERQPTIVKGGAGMPNKDETEGRIKEAAGDLTGDKDLQREGKVDQGVGKAKDAVDDAGDKAKDALDRD